jgi:hypothetical protein
MDPARPVHILTFIEPLHTLSAVVAFQSLLRELPSLNISQLELGISSLPLHYFNLFSLGFTNQPFLV